MEFVTQSSSPNAPPRRAWFRYRLRTFLILVSLIAVWLGWTVHRARTQRGAVAAIRAARGTVMFDYHENGPRSWSTAGTPRGPRWMRDQLGSEYFDRPVYIKLFGTPENGAWIDAVNQLPSVKTLLLSGPNVNDDTLVRLEGSTSLRELHLNNSSVSDEGLRHLAKFSNLRWLVLDYTSISDAGAAYFSDLSMLEDLSLMKTKISDKSISLFVGLPNLQQIDLRRTRVTADGIEEFKKLRPKLTVLH
jgi:hypothetical protein